MDNIPSDDGHHYRGSLSDGIFYLNSIVHSCTANRCECVPSRDRFATSVLRRCPKRSEEQRLMYRYVAKPECERLSREGTS